MIEKKILHKYYKNKQVLDLVFKVLDYNFNNSEKTNKFLELFESYLLNENKSISEMKNYLKNNNLELSKEDERVDNKIKDLSKIISECVLGTPQNILDIGVGNGNILVNMGDNLNIDSSALFGIDVCDYSENKNFNHIKYNKDLMPLESESIDLIFIMMVLHHTNDPKKVLLEAYRVLSNSGSIIVRETNSYSNELLEFNILMEYIFYTVLLELPINITDNYLHKNKWELLFKEVGFECEKVKETELKNDPFTSVYYKLTK